LCGHPFFVISKYIVDSEKTMPIKRPDGVNDSERYLKSLCDHTFLSLWSYSSIHKTPGKELCDLLVIFEENIIIFSDKDCKFPDTQNIKLDWNRWFKRAIEKSADQAWGAERWIKKNPKRMSEKSGFKLTVEQEDE